MKKEKKEKKRKKEMEIFAAVATLGVLGTVGYTAYVNSLPAISKPDKNPEPRIYQPVGLQVSLDDVVRDPAIFTSRPSMAPLSRVEPGPYGVPRNVHRDPRNPNAHFYTAGDSPMIYNL